MTLTTTWDMGAQTAAQGPKSCVCSALRSVFAWEPGLPGMLLAAWDPRGTFTADSLGLKDCRPSPLQTFPAAGHQLLSLETSCSSEGLVGLHQKTELSGVSVSRDLEKFPRTTSLCPVKETSSSQQSQPRIPSSHRRGVFPSQPWGTRVCEQ